MGNCQRPEIEDWKGESEANIPEPPSSVVIGSRWPLWAQAGHRDKVNRCLLSSSLRHCLLPCYTFFLSSSYGLVFLCSWDRKHLPEKTDQFREFFRLKASMSTTSSTVVVLLLQAINVSLIDDGNIRIRVSIQWQHFIISYWHHTETVFMLARYVVISLQIKDSPLHAHKHKWTHSYTNKWRNREIKRLIKDEWKQKKVKNRWVQM